MEKKDLTGIYQIQSKIKPNILLIKVRDFASLKNSSFKREKDLRKYIVDNIIQFTEDILDDVYISHKEEQEFSKKYHLGLSRRVDLLIYGENNLYIVELKNPRYQSENRGAIGQLLCYGQEFLDSKKRLVLISTKFDIHTATAIQHYKLPIRYIYFDKDKCIEFIEIPKK